MVRPTLLTGDSPATDLDPAAPAADRLDERAEVGASENAGPDDASLRKRLLRPQTVISFVVALGIVAFFARRLDIDAGAVWRNIRSASLAPYLAAAGLYYVAFLGRAIRWRWMLERAGLDAAHGFDLPRRGRMVQILLLAWFVNCVIPAKIGDAYRCYLLKRDSGAPMSRSLGTVLAERLTDLVVLFLAMITAGLLTFRGNLPDEATRTLVIGVVLLTVGAFAVSGLWFGRRQVEQRLPERFRSQFQQLHHAIFACLRSPWRPVGVSILIWIGDGLRLYLVARALHADLAYPAAAFVALMSALLTTLPITPAGLGVVEVAMVAILKLVDIEASLAGSIALMDRLLTYWSLVVVGLILYIRQFRADVRGRSTS